MSHEQPTAETMRPERMNYPHTAEGQMAFNGALIQWQHSAIEALTSELDSSKQIASRFANELRAATHKNTALQLAVDEMMKETERLRQELTMEQLAHLSTLGQLQERPAQPPAAPHVEPICRVINNNQSGWTNIVETAPNVTLDVGSPLYSRDSVMQLAAALAGAIHRAELPAPTLVLPHDPRELLVTTARDAGFSDAQWKSMFYESGPYDITFPSYPMKQFAKLLIDRLSPTKESTP